MLVWSIGFSPWYPEHPRRKEINSRRQGVGNRGAGVIYKQDLSTLLFLNNLRLPSIAVMPIAKSNIVAGSGTGCEKGCGTAMISDEVSSTCQAHPDQT